ncbi:MAG: shikimate dehydrogenase [Actinomyces sp.]|uniref:shikimate dehydrogenase n=1 Tax=Actinomyces sp. TaxID=29317 RepID=UPI0026DAF171|nr:shikimate dehydrogenase [Actinomyces sp.]MDO4244242.1 shikimate dehydrogenase [Actinomyces sp.]
MPDSAHRSTAGRAAVIGQPVSHSLSPVLHRAAYADLGLDDWLYRSIEVTAEDLPALLERVAAVPDPGAPAWAGLSVTMPHKQDLVEMLDIVDPLAQVVGAVNTVVVQRPGRDRGLLVGFNTDVAGIVAALAEVRRCNGHTSPQPVGEAVVLGAGATACSALAALAQLGASRIIVVARNHAGPRRALAAAHRMGLEVSPMSWRPGDPDSDSRVATEMARAEIVVSTLPAGGADHLAAPLGAALADRGPVTPGAAMLDVVYAPWPTPLAEAWQRGGAAVAPGWLMLLHQATPQVRLMTGRTPRLAPMRTALRRALDAR